MLKILKSDARFRPINRAYNTVFKPGRLSIGLVVPIEAYPDGPVPTMQHQTERIQHAENLGFPAVWLRDVPFNVPSFGDAGQIFDPFVYLGTLAAMTETIALGVASIVLPLRHPAHVAKAAATADVLSDGRLILGIASGDRPEEFPALAKPFGRRGDLFRESYDYIRAVSETTPRFSNEQGCITGGLDMLPKPTSGSLPLLVTGSSQQAPDWIAANGDGWMTYPRPAPQQARLINSYRNDVQASGTFDKPVMEPLYVDLADHPDTPPSPIHLGIHTGTKGLRDYLRSREEIGVNHIALNLRFNRADPNETLKKLADELLPDFSIEDTAP